MKLVQPVRRLRRARHADRVRGGMVASQVQWSHQARAADDWLKQVVSWTWKVKLAPALGDLFARLREGAEEVAIKVFGDNVRDLLLAAPAGNKGGDGLDPAFAPA